MESEGARLALAAASVAALLTGCIPLWGQPRYLADPAMIEADAGHRRGDADDRDALRRLAAFPTFPRVDDLTAPSADSALAAGAVAVAQEIGREGVRDADAVHAVEFVLRRRRRAAFHAIATAARDPVAVRRATAIDLARDVYYPCRTDLGGAAAGGAAAPRTPSSSPCAGWPERDELVRAVVAAATSDPDLIVRRAAMSALRFSLRGAPIAREEIVLAVEREGDEGVREDWLNLLLDQPLLPAAQGIDLARRHSEAAFHVRELLGRYLVAENQPLLEDAFRRGDAAFRRALGNAIADRKEALPWATSIVEQGLFDDDPYVRACFAADVVAIQPVPERIRARLAATAATWESSRTALAFLRESDAGRPTR